MGFRRLLGSLVCFSELVFFVLSDRPLCVGNKVVASLDASQRVTPLNDKGELLKSQGGECYCNRAGDDNIYLSCVENLWPAIAQQPPDKPMMCATGRNEEGKAECPQISKEYLSLLKGYDIATLEKGTQQTAICDKNSGEKLGVMEQGLFQRDAGIENNYYQAVSGCSCGKAESAKERTMKCKPWPKSLSVSYHDNDPNVICVDGLSCPKSK